MKILNFEDLNLEQKKAVLTINGPVRIIAGPGSGKTRTIIAKAQYLLEEELAFPNQILILTFTNKAANEIKERIAAIDQKLSNVFTFHGFAAYFLRLEAKRINIEQNYVILDRNDQLQIIKREIKNIEDEKGAPDLLNAKEVLENFVGYYYDHQLLENDLQEKNLYKKIIARLYDKYVVYKNKINAFDFDDLLIKMNEVLKEYLEVREYWKRKFRYLFVDEFQDTNHVQYQIVRSLTDDEANITVVGDPDQNIYSWRGSDLNIILNFVNDYKNVKTVILKNNYRSTPNIIEIANKLISNNQDRVIFNVQAMKASGLRPQLTFYYSKNQQAEKIVNKIIYLTEKKKISLNQIAIINRANYLFRDFENVLIRRGIKYQTIGGYKFYEREEIKKIIYYLRFLLFEDDFSFINIVNFPARGFGTKSLEKIQNTALIDGKTIWEVLKENQKKQSSKVVNFIQSTFKIAESFENNLSAEDFFKQFEQYLNEINFIAFYKENEARDENINNFLQQLRDNFINSKDLREDLLAFINSIALQSSADKEEIPNHLTLITAHAAKGTEFEAVFLPSFNENIFPTYQVESKKQMEEERRVAYVAITRAKSEIYFSYLQGYDYNGTELLPSKFLSEMGMNKLNFSFDNSYNNKVTEEKNFKIPQGYSNDKLDIKPGDIIYHKIFKEGVVLSEDDQYIFVAFAREIGKKMLIKNHDSWVKKV